MRWTLALLPLLASVVPAIAQEEDGDDNDASYPETVLGALEGAGLTTLASALTVLAGTDGGDAFFADLQDGDKTVFAPTNEAFTSAGFPEDFSTVDASTLDVAMLSQVLQYHIIEDDITDEEIAVSPANTIKDTMLEGGMDSTLINFGDDESVPLVLTRESEDAEGFSIFNNGEPIAVNGEATEVGNIQLYTIDQLIPLPPSLAELAESAGLTQLAGALTDAGLLEALNSSSGGLTIFAPNDAAFEAIASDIEGLDEETVVAVLSNHVVNGTVAFSDDIEIEGGDDDDDDEDSNGVTPLAGEPLTFTQMDGTIMVNSGNATANIVATDYVFNGGVVHVIDAVLVNADAETNPAPSGTTSSMSPTATSGGDGDDNDAESSTPASTGSDSAGNFAGKVSVDFATFGLGGVVVALGAVMGGGLVL